MLNKLTPFFFSPSAVPSGLCKKLAPADIVQRRAAGEAGKSARSLPRSIQRAKPVLQNHFQQFRGRGYESQKTLIPEAPNNY